MGWIRAIAVDLDGTIATNDVVSEGVLRAIRDARRCHVRVLLVTGRTVAALDEHFPGLIGRFDAVVAENGCVLMGLGRHRLLVEPVNRGLADGLQQRGIHLDRGEVLLSTSADDDAAVLEAITARGLDCVMLRNRGELMILPAGVSKGSGLEAALELFGISAHNTMAVGDAENDHAMFEVAELAIAPANALQPVKEHADVVLTAPDGLGVAALLEGPITTGEQRPRWARRQVRIGTLPDGSPALIPASNATILVVGASGRGKSYLAGVVAEQLIDRGYRLLVVDPEGEQSCLGELPYVEVIMATTRSDAYRTVQGLRHSHSVVLDLSELTTATRLELLQELAGPLTDLRNEIGLPQWLLVDEAHGLFDANGVLRALFDPTAGGHCLVTFHPERLCPQVLSRADVVLSVSPPVDQLIGVEDLPASGLPRAVCGQALMLHADRAGAAQSFRVAPRITTHQRHQRKYARTMLPAGKGFRFRSSIAQQLPEARSVEQFHDQLRDIDPDSLGWHLVRGDISRWVAEVVQDRELAEQIAGLERGLVHQYQAQVFAARDELSRAIDARYLRSGDPAPRSAASADSAAAAS
jgi:phosphoglycolate phosphatase (TIGR01487 family)